MNTEYRYLPELGGEAPVTEFEEILPKEGKPFPPRRITSFMTLGPFVLETKGAFETEYLYERNITLDRDYLASSGGEAAMKPYLGKAEINDYWGPSTLCWSEGEIRWDSVHLGNGKTFEDNNAALYVTPQRNCVFYAAVYVRCKGEQNAIVSYESSGAMVYLNGQRVDYEPYGRVKSLSTLGRQFFAHFNDGLNLLVFKIRTGYIADGIDFCLSHMCIHPIMAENGGVAVTYPAVSGAYLGTKEAPRQAFYLFAGSRTGAEGGVLRYASEGYAGETEIPAMQAGQCCALRISVPSTDENRISAVRAELGGAKFDFEVETRPRPAYDGTELLFSDFHFDTTYHEEQRTYAFGAFDITRNMVEERRRNPDFRLTLSEVDYLHPYYSIFPQDRELIKKSFEDGTAEADCFYNQPNDLTSSAEGLTRNLIYGQLYHKGFLGQKKLVFAPGDVYGHPNQISQMCAKGEVVSMRWAKCIVGLDSAFRHMSPDGTEMLHIKQMEMKDSMRLHLKHSLNGSELPGELPSYPVGGDLSWLKDTVNHAHYACFSELNEGVEKDDEEHLKKTGRRALQTLSRDLTQHHTGTLLTRSDFKQANRLAENLLVTAEKIATVAALNGAQYPEKTLDKGWRQLLCAQHHDSITGTNNEISFVDLMIEYRECMELAESVIYGALKQLSEAVSVPDGEQGILAFNPHPWERTEKCLVRLDMDGDYLAVDEAGKEYPLVEVRKGMHGERVMAFCAEMPALGYKSFALKKRGDAPAACEDIENTIENEFFRLRVDPKQGGGIVSIYDKVNGREVCENGVDGPANRVVAIREVPDRRETQHEFYTTGQKLYSTESNAKVRRVCTELYQRLEITFKMDTVARVRQTITLWKGSKRIDMQTVVEDYIARDDLFTVTFPVNVKGGRVIYDDRFAPHVVNKGINKLSFQTHQYYAYSHCRVAPVNQWIEVGPTVGAKMGNGVLQLGMTAIIRNDKGEAPEGADRLLRVLTRKAIPVTLYPEGPITDIEVRSRIAHNPPSVYGSAYGDWRLPHFNEDLTNTDTRFVLSLATDEKCDYVRTLEGRLTEEQRARYEKKLAEDGVALVYCVDSDNALSKPIDVILVRAKDETALENWIAELDRQLDNGHRIDLSSAVCADPVGAEDDYGVALLNQGNIACSVEGENMLNMMLFHTADFYGNMGRVTGGEQLIPEQKTYSAVYSLYPHAGSYREGNVYRQAMEFNDPFVAELCKAGITGSLPSEKSYFKTDAGFITTCFKMGGFDMALMSQKKRSIAERGIAVRGFETDGMEKTVRFETGFGLNGVSRVNLLEHEPQEMAHDEGGFTDDVKRFSIETYHMDTDAVSDALTGCPVPERETVQPVYVRSWEHDLGSMPMGYFALVGTIDRRIRAISPTEIELRVNMVNNQTDARATGRMTLSASAGMTTDKGELDYDLAPGAYASYKVKLTKPSEDTEGTVRLTYEDDGQRFCDVYEIGAFDPEFTLRDEGGRLVATVFNKTSERLIGQMALATPIETWEMAGNPNALSSIPMGYVPVDLAPGERKEFEFPFAELEDGLKHSFWAAGKLMINGHIYFAFVHRKGAHHNLWADEFTIEIFADNGSQRKLFERGAR